MSQIITNGMYIFALDVTLRATVVLALAGLAATWMRRGPAARRHAVWGTALAGVLIVLAASALPGWRVLPAIATPPADAPVHVIGIATQAPADPAPTSSLTPVAVPTDLAKALNTVTAELATMKDVPVVYLVDDVVDETARSHGPWTWVAAV